MKKRLREISIQRIKLSLAKMMEQFVIIEKWVMELESLDEPTHKNNKEKKQ